MSAVSKPPSEHARRSRSASLAVVLAIVVLAGALRLVGLARNPPAINQDEAERAYEAYCLRQTGRDYHNKPWPIFFRAFGVGDYPPGHYIYTLIPVQAALGMSVWSTRLPAAVLGTLHVLFLYWLVAQLYGRRVGVLAALLLAVSPWHIHLSRLAFEVSLCLPLLTLGLYLVVRAGRRASDTPASAVGVRDSIGLFAGGLLLGLVAWGYNALRVVVPLLLIGGLMLFLVPMWRFLRRRRGWLAGGVFLFGLAVGLAPFIYATIATPDEAWGRASTETLFGGGRSLRESLVATARVYALHLGPSFLFAKGDPSAVQSVPGYGQLHYYCALLLPLGVARVLWRWRRERFGLFVLGWILVAPLPAAVTDLQAGHALRSAAMLPACQILAALGLDWLLAAVAIRSVRWQRVALGVAIVGILLNAGWFLKRFACDYPITAARAFQAKWADVIREVQRRSGDCDAAVLTMRGTTQLSMLYLFWTQMDPQAYRAADKQIIEDDPWDYTVRIGDTWFLPSEVFLKKAIRRYPRGSRIVLAERPDVAVPGYLREVRRFRYPDGTDAVVLYELR